MCSQKQILHTDICNVTENETEKIFTSFLLPLFVWYNWVDILCSLHQTASEMKHQDLVALGKASVSFKLFKIPQTQKENCAETTDTEVYVREDNYSSLNNW